MLTAHASSADVHGGVAALLRLGPILPILLVAAAALVHRRSALSLANAVAVIASAAAGGVHLALTPEHFGAGLVVGVAFALDGFWQVALGILLAVDHRRRGRWIVAAQATAVVVAAVYVASRTTRVPFFEGKEAFDALGIITTLLAAVAGLAPLIGRHRERAKRSMVVLPGLFVAMAAAAPVVFGVSGVFGRGALIIAAAVAVLLVAGATDQQLWWAAGDGAILAVLLRSSNVGVFVVAGLIAGLVRAAGARWGVRPPPAALATAVVLAVGPLDGRLDLVHVGHTGDTVAAVVVFVVSGAVAYVAMADGRTGALVVFYAMYAAIELCRLVAGATSLGAIEVPITSLSVWLLVAAAVLDGSLLPSARAATVAGGAAGLAIGVLRTLNVAYPTPWGVVVGVGAVAIARSWSARRRPFLRDRTVRASVATLPGSGSSRSDR